MILLISAYVLFFGIIFVIIGISKNIEFLGVVGSTFIICSIVIGFGVFGLIHPIESEIIIPSNSFIEKNENSVVLVVPNTGNKLITDPAIINFIEVDDTIKIKKKYNSYGGQIGEAQIYVEKNGYKY